MTDCLYVCSTALAAVQSRPGVSNPSSRWYAYKPFYNNVNNIEVELTVNIIQRIRLNF